MPGRKVIARLLAGLAAVVMFSSPASAAVTGMTGGGAPEPTVQPSLGMNYIIRTDITNGNDAFLLGEIAAFGGSFAPAGWAFASGQVINIADKMPLFNAIGANYGGNGTTTFALPDLRGRTPIGAGAGPGLSTRALGAAVGQNQVMLTTANLPPHTHTLPVTGSTDSTGGGQPFANMQPSLAINFMTPLFGIYPSSGGGFIGTTPVLGMVTMTARTTALNGFMFAQGQALDIGDNDALFSLIGNAYGGNGQDTFALPDLRGRAVMHAGTGPGLTPRTIGNALGAESVMLTTAQLPPHTHSIAGPLPTGSTGVGQTHTNLQPSLALNYIIALTGIFPPPDEGTGPAFDDEPFIGEISLFAGNFAPGGWALCNGQLLSIGQNQALFSIIGNTYGGDGQSTFALPDLRGRIGVDDGTGIGLTPRLAGEADGVESQSLSVDQMPAHDHTYAEIPEPAGAVIAVSLLGVCAASGRPCRRR